MVNPDRIERYEWVCLDNTKVLPVTEFYDVLADKFEFPKKYRPDRNIQEGILISSCDERVI
jgi:hypothetical protein